MKGDFSTSNYTSYNNPLIRPDQNELHDRYKNINQGFVDRNPIVGPQGGGVRPGNETTMGNPLQMPDYTLRNHYAAEQNKEWAQQNSITKKRVDQGLKTTNESSYDNPFNTIRPDRYQELTQANQQQVNQDSYAKRAQRQAGGVGLGTHSSMDNPLNTYPKHLKDEAARRNKVQVDYEAELRKQARGAGGGISTGNITSSNNPLHTMDPQMMRQYAQRNKLETLNNPGFA